MKKRFKVIFVILMLFLFVPKISAMENYSLKTETSLKSTTVKPGDSFTINVGVCDIATATAIASKDIIFYYDGNVIEACNTDAEDNCVNYRDGWTWTLYADYHNTKDAYLKAKMSAKSQDSYINANTQAYCSEGIQSLINFKFKIKNSATNQNTTITVVDDNNQKRTIDLKIYSKSSNTYLSDINLNNDNLELYPTFNKNNTEYEVFVPYDIEKINITANAEDSSATVSGTGEKQLEVGDNKISLIVTAENAYKKTYTINVIRKDANDDTSLSKVLVTDSNKKKVSLVYDEKSKTYTGNVSSEITFVSFDIKCSGENCFVNELNSEPVKEGSNEFNFTVVSQNGDKEEYKIIINKEVAKKYNSILYLSIGLGVCVLLCVVLLILYLKDKNK